MTREEAIKELQSYAEHSWRDLNDAFKMAISALRKQETVTDSHQMTNAERIRAMSDEELAVLIAREIVHVPHSGFYVAKSAWLRWLHETVEEQDG